MLRRSDPREHAALRNAIRKLESEGPRLGYPWSSAVRGATTPGLRELRPRAGRSRQRALYAWSEGVLILLALAPEAGHSPHAFREAVRQAGLRLALHDDRGGST